MNVKNADDFYEILFADELNLHVHASINASKVQPFVPDDIPRRTYARTQSTKAQHRLTPLTQCNKKTNKSNSTAGAVQVEEILQ